MSLRFTNKSKAVSLDDYMWLCSVCRTPRRFEAVNRKAPCARCGSIDPCFLVEKIPDSIEYERDKIRRSRVSNAVFKATKEALGTLGEKTTKTNVRGYMERVMPPRQVYHPNHTVLSTPDHKTGGLLMYLSDNTEPLFGDKITMESYKNSKPKKVITTIRLPKDLKAWLQNYCVRKNTTMTKEIIDLLKSLKENDTDKVEEVIY